MPYAIHVVPDLSCILVNMHGDVDLSDASGIVVGVADVYPSFVGVSVICDVRKVNVKLSFPEIFELGRVFFSQRTRLTGVKWAMISTTPLEYAAARAAGLVVPDVAFQYNVVRSSEEACQWAGIPQRRWREIAQWSDSRLDLSGSVDSQSFGTTNT